MSLELTASINTGDLDKRFKRISEELQETVNGIIYDYLVKIKEKGLEIRAWKNRTGTLEASHLISATQDGGILVVNPFTNPQNGKIVTTDYAVILEYYMDYAWIGPAVDMVQDEMLEEMKDQIKKLIDKELGQTVIRKSSRGKVWEQVIYKDHLGRFIKRPV